MRESDRIRLRHMLDAADEAICFARDRNRADLEGNRLLALGLVKCVEVIGEAASRVTAEMRAELHQIPWADVVGMRNRLVHAYFDVDLDQVWRTVRDDLPPLAAELRNALGRER